jgi:uncharacterized protein (TIGR00290 family)
VEDRAGSGTRQLGVTARVALSWSSGKDSALALWTLRAEQHVEPAALMTTITEDYERVSMHGVRRVLVERQAAALGLPLVEVAIPPGCSNELYEERFAAALQSGALRGCEAVAFGDLYLEDVRTYREQLLAASGKRGLFPLWQRDTSMLARRFVAAAFEAVVVSVDPGRLDPAFAGRRFDQRFLCELPRGVDHCGENGEFHTFVHAGPIFDVRIECEVGRVLRRDGFAFCDIRPAIGAPAYEGSKNDPAAAVSEQPSDAASRPHRHRDFGLGL